MNKINLKNMMVISGLIYIGGLLMLFPEAGYCAAKDLSTIASNVKGNLSAVEKLLYAVSYITGMGFMMGSLFQFKHHKEAPTQTPLSKPIVLLLVGACLIGIPSFKKLGGESLGMTESGSATGSVMKM